MGKIGTLTGCVLVCALMGSAEAAVWADRDGQTIHGVPMDYDFETKEVVFQSPDKSTFRVGAVGLNLSSKMRLVFGNPGFIKSWYDWIAPKLSEAGFETANQRIRHALIWLAVLFSLVFVSRFFGGWHLITQWSDEAGFLQWCFTYALGGLGWIIGGVGALALSTDHQLSILIGVVWLVHVALIWIMHRPKFSAAFAFPLCVHVLTAVSLLLSLFLPVLVGTWRVTGKVTGEAINQYLTVQWFEMLHMM